MNKSANKNLIFLYQYIKPYKKEVLLTAISLLISACSVLALGQAIGFFVDNGLNQQKSGILQQSLSIFFVISMLLAISTFTRVLIISQLSEKTMENIRNDLYKHIISLPITSLETRKVGELLSLIISDTEVIKMIIGNSISIAMRNIVMVTGGIILLIVTNWQLTLYIFLIIPFIIVIIKLIGRRIKNIAQKIQEVLAVLSSQTEESLNGIYTVKSYVKSDCEIDKFMKTNHELRLLYRQKDKLRSILVGLVIGIILSGITFVLWVGGIKVINHDITAGNLSSFVFYSLMVAGSMNSLSEVMGNVQKAMGVTERIRGIMNLETEKSNGKQVNQVSPSNINLRFRDVSFKYPSGTDYTLRNISFEVRAGENIAIVGASGSGKTTLFKLLLRFYDTSSGDILISGQSIKDINIEELRKLFSVVLQDATIFSGTVKENIMYGVQEQDDIQLLENVAQIANVNEFVHDMPNKFDTEVGVKGIKLSGGQKQRIAIARAVAKNTGILLLDEATSALDVANEKLIKDALYKIMHNRTTLIIAHRLSTILRADRIIVLEHGVIQDIGTHEELLKSNKTYQHYYKLNLDSNAE